ncbi:MAG: hypothetical protein KJZ98_02930 [Burkholderiaceae bacterium]|jgi:hypothetical protein|nr:hypothetical protein [Burkholderiaceae bacterium]MEB2351498.1 hypothetical protein [Burkholderiaceae bacterium]
MRHASPSLAPLALITLGLQSADAFAQAGNPHNGTWAWFAAKQEAARRRL